MPALTMGKAKYEPTADDKLWLMRAVQAEGEPREMVARALINLFAYAKQKKSYKGTLADMVRSYAQPVNPAWYPTGGKFIASLQTKDEEETKEALAAANRRKDVHSSRTTFAPSTVAAVKAALGTSYGGDVTDYAAPFLDARLKGYLARSEPITGENRLWSRAPGWRGYVVEGGSSVLLWLAMGVVAWKLFQRGAT